MTDIIRKMLRSALAVLLCLVMLTGCAGKEEGNGTEPEPVDPEDQEIIYTIDNIRDYVVGVDDLVELNDGTMVPLINFDNAATTPALKPVMDAVDEKLRMYGSIGRGFSQKSNYSTDFT